MMFLEPTLEYKQNAVEAAGVAEMPAAERAGSCQCKMQARPVSVPPYLCLPTTASGQAQPCGTKVLKILVPLVLLFLNQPFPKLNTIKAADARCCGMGMQAHAADLLLDILGPIADNCRKSALLFLKY